MSRLSHDDCTRFNVTGLGGRYHRDADDPSWRGVFRLQRRLARMLRRERWSRRQTVRRSLRPRAVRTRSTSARAASNSSDDGGSSSGDEPDRAGLGRADRPSEWSGR